MDRFFIHWFLMTLALAITAWVVPGVQIQSTGALLIGALVLGFLNAVLKPILVLFTLPLTVMTLGLFYFILNGVVFALASVLVPGFEVAGFGSAFLGALLMGFVSLLLGGTARK